MISFSFLKHGFQIFNFYTTFITEKRERKTRRSKLLWRNPKSCERLTLKALPSLWELEADQPELVGRFSSQSFGRPEGAITARLHREQPFFRVHIVQGPGNGPSSGFSFPLPSSCLAFPRVPRSVLLSAVTPLSYVITLRRLLLSIKQHMWRQTELSAGSEDVLLRMRRSAWKAGLFSEELRCLLS